MTTADRTVPPRPKCHAKLLDVEDNSLPGIPSNLAGLDPHDNTIRWIPTGTCLAHFTCNSWLKVMRQLIFHPERNSSNILRADITGESSSTACLHSQYQSEITITRRILPRRPTLDAALRQVCKIYRDDADNALVVYTPLVDDGCLPQEPSQIPFYHPKVRAIAFQFQSRPTFPDLSIAFTSSEEPILADIFIYIIPFQCDSHFDASKQQSHRLSRTTLSLLETQAQHSWGTRHDYQKRVIHDTLVPREEYMDLYLSLKEKYASIIINHWVESTDARKHVFEDIGIAAFIILLWKETSRLGGAMPSSFVDVGCGNGLLVHLLNAEGYSGFGFDLQPRKSWSVWEALPGGADLRVISLDAPAMVQDSASIFPPSSFLIGNHADELTSWLPLLAHSIPSCSGFINIPCCSFQLDGQHFSNTKFPFPDEIFPKLLGRSMEDPIVQMSKKEFERGPPTQNTGTTSRNVAYLRYLSHSHLQTGWHLEKEALRIPSTKNWCFVGRRRIWQRPLTVEQDCITEETINELRAVTDKEVKRLTEEHGLRWKARLPPGKGAAAATLH